MKMKDATLPPRTRILSGRKISMPCLTSASMIATCSEVLQVLKDPLISDQASFCLAAEKSCKTSLPTESDPIVSLRVGFYQSTWHAIWTALRREGPTLIPAGKCTSRVWIGQNSTPKTRCAPANGEATIQGLSLGYLFLNAEGQSAHCIVGNYFSPWSREGHRELML